VEGAPLHRWMCGKRTLARRSVSVSSSPGRWGGEIPAHRRDKNNPAHKSLVRRSVDRDSFATDDGCEQTRSSLAVRLAGGKHVVVRREEGKGREGEGGVCVG
jgi:hypothetical protein